MNATLAGRFVDIAALEAKKESGGLDADEGAELERAKAAQEVLLEDFAGLRDLGVVVATGSDPAWGRDKMGGLQHQIGAHVEIGMSPTEAIVSATHDSARLSWVDDEVGTLKEGKQADVLVVDGDPSEDIKVLWNSVGVFQRGDLVDWSSLL